MCDCQDGLLFTRSQLPLVICIILHLDTRMKRFLMKTASVNCKYLIQNVRIIFFGSILCFPVTKASTFEDVQVKLYRINFLASNSETQKMLKKADLELESHGFNREILTTKLAKEPGSYEPEYQVTVDSLVRI